MLFALGVLQNAASEDIDHNADQVYDTLIGNISPQVLWPAMIGQYADVILVVSLFVIFLWIPLLSLRMFFV